MGGTPTPGDPLDQLRSLLRAQVQAATDGHWDVLGRLTEAVAAELEAAGRVRATPAALAEVAHLQLRLEQTLRTRVRDTAAQLRRHAASRAYQAHSPK